MIPEIADYEVRRELLRAGKEKGLGRLDALPITTPVMLKAAEFWATLLNSSNASPNAGCAYKRHPFRSAKGPRGIAN
ncbi:MAG: hypothetical protein WD696_07095 [Bryobacteraceae bacterium]